MYRLIESKALSIFKNGTNESIALKEYVEINGVQQGMIIEGENIQNPVLLFLHGGPGFPEYPMIKGENLLLHNYFTICYWDQRGSGLSFYSNKEDEPITLGQLIEDTVAVTKYLCKKFNKEKIFLFGHSWGTFLGVITASKYPDYYHAYIGAGQLGNATESEKETLEFIRNEARKRRDKKVEKQVQGINIDQNYYKNKDYLKIRGRYLSKYGGGIKHKGASNRKLLKQYLFFKPYTLKERINIFRGGMNASSLMETIAKNRLIDLAPELEIPIYIIQGKYDYTTTHNQARIFFDEIKAPKKKFYTFDSSAHSPFIEERELFYDIIKEDILVNFQ